VQMTWGVEPGDMTHKVAKMRAELKRGNHIEVVMAKKKRVPVPPQGEREAKVNEIVLALAEVGREVKRTRTAIITTVSLRPLKQETPTLHLSSSAP